LSSGDFYEDAHREEEAKDQLAADDRSGIHIRAFAWPLLVQAGGLAAVAGTKLQLTPAGRKALARPPHEALRALWSKWQQTKLLDEFNRVSAIKGQTGKGKSSFTPVARRRSAIVETLEECPPGEWISAAEFLRFLRAAGHDFTVTRDEWQLHLGSPQYYGLSGRAVWGIIQGRYARAYLMEYAATLGLLDIACISPWEAECDFIHVDGADEISYLSRYDGLTHLRITPLGAWVFGHTEQYAANPVVDEPLWKVLPNLEVAVTARSLPPALELNLKRFTDPQSDSVWRLSTPRCLAAIEEGIALEELRDLLSAHNEGPLPSAVATYLDDLGKRGKQLRDRGAAHLIECTETHVAHLLANDRRLRNLVWVAGDRHLVYRAADDTAVRRGLREAGYPLPPATA
jgi:hypothetical protein